jgi:hypothetical protein
MVALRRTKCHGSVFGTGAASSMTSSSSWLCPITLKTQRDRQGRSFGSRRRRTLLPLDFSAAWIRAISELLGLWRARQLRIRWPFPSFQVLV